MQSSKLCAVVGAGTIVALVFTLLCSDRDPASLALNSQITDSSESLTEINTGLSHREVRATLPSPAPVLAVRANVPAHSENEPALEETERSPDLADLLRMHGIEGARERAQVERAWREATARLEKLRRPTAPVD